MVETKETKENIIIKEAKEVLEKNEKSLKETKEMEEITENKEKELTEKLQRLQAEFENFQKRTEKEKENIKQNANAELITELLNMLDNFELSLKNNKDKGVTLIYEELNGILKKQGLKIIDTKGKFDPRFHEAMIQEEGKEHGVILEELQKGYQLNDKLLRASKVKISTTK